MEMRATLLILVLGLMGAAFAEDAPEPPMEPPVEAEMQIELIDAPLRRVKRGTNTKTKPRNTVYSSSDQKKIVKKHNDYRQKERAANMEKMVKENVDLEL